MSEYPHVPAAFINALAEEGTKKEVIGFLQEQWNETCALRTELKEAKRLLALYQGDEGDMGICNGCGQPVWEKGYPE